MSHLPWFAPHRMTVLPYRLLRRLIPCCPYRSAVKSVHGQTLTQLPASNPDYNYHRWVCHNCYNARHPHWSIQTKANHVYQYTPLLLMRQHRRNHRTYSEARTSYHNEFCSNQAWRNWSPSFLFHPMSCHPSRLLRTLQTHICHLTDSCPFHQNSHASGNILRTSMMRLLMNPAFLVFLYDCLICALTLHNPPVNPCIP